MRYDLNLRHQAHTIYLSASSPSGSLTGMCATVFIATNFFSLTFDAGHCSDSCFYPSLFSEQSGLLLLSNNNKQENDSSRLKSTVRLCRARRKELRCLLFEPKA